jgi:Holliday junction resolvasome RuvABC DNA-binding subunit
VQIVGNADTSTGAGTSGLAGDLGGAEQDAVSALVNLGYQRTDAYSAVLQAKQKAQNDNETNSLNVQEMITLALKELSH